MFPLLQFGPLSLQTAPLVLLFGLWISLTLAEKHAVLHKVEPSLISKLTLFTLLAGLAGARVFFILRYPSAFLHNPAGIISTSPLLLDVQGGLLVAALTALIYIQRKNMPLWSTLDALAAPIAVLAAALALAHFASGDAYGRPTRLPWGIPLWGLARHPTQLYELILAAAAGLAVWPRQKSAGDIFDPPGARFLLLAAVLSLGRVLLDPFYADPPILFGFLRSAQVTAWLALALSGWALNRKWRHA